MASFRGYLLSLLCCLLSVVWVCWLALWINAPLVPVMLVWGGIFEDTAETVGSSVILGLMALAWIVIGLSIRSASANRRAPVTQA